MSLLTIQPSGTTIATAEGQTLLQLITAAGLAVPGKCGGVAKCGGCHIFVLSGREHLSKPSVNENAKLDSIVGVGSKSRLACQTRVERAGDVTVELLDFASGF